MLDVDILPVAPAYETQIRALSDKTQRDHEARLPHIFYDGGAHQQQLLDIIFDSDVHDNVRAFVALKENVLVGYVLVIPDQLDSTKQPTNALIADICVVKDFRGQGIAAALLAACEQEKNRMGWESLRAQVWQGNDPSHALFKRAGYAAERTDYRLGTPSVTVPPPPKRQFHWLIGICILLISAAAAYLLL